jgi:tetratricopeptide (TPR) repeat protein
MTSLQRIVFIVLLFLLAAQKAGAQNPADAAWTAGDFETARALYTERLAADSSDIRALHRLALLFAWDDRYDESLVLFDRLLVVSPENLEARIDRARVISWTGDFKRSIASYEEALERHPGDRQVLLGLAVVLSWADRLDSALTIYDALVMRDSADIQARHGLARAAAWRGSLVEAERLWRETLEQEGSTPETLIGLAQTLRWQGRADAAQEVLARVPVEARRSSGYVEEERWIGVALGTRMSPSLVLEFDSDDNTMATLALRGGHQIKPRFQVGIDTYYRWAEGLVTGDGLTSRRAWGVAATGRRLFEPGWTVRGGLGLTGSNATEGSVEPSLQASVTSPGRLRFGGTLAFVRTALDATALLIENGTTYAMGSLDFRVQPAYRWIVEFGGSYSRFQGSESNRRLVGYAAATHRISPPWTAVGRLRVFGFEKSRQDGFFDGYFNPDSYFYGEIIGRWQPVRGLWSVMLEVAPALEQAGSNASLRAAGRLLGRATYDLAPGRQIGLSALYANNGLQAFSSGEEGYRYFAVTLSGTWVF